MESQQVISLHNYRPREDEKEKTSNCYLMSVVAVMAGLPLPIINLLASCIFFISNRNASFFVKWHCTQALLSQFTIFIINSVAFTWTMKILFGSASPTNHYFGYLAAIVIVNIIEFVINIIAAIRLRKGIHTEWWFWGALTNMVLKQK